MLRVATCRYFLLQDFTFSNHSLLSPPGGKGLVQQAFAPSHSERQSCSAPPSQKSHGPWMDLEIQKDGAHICNMFWSSKLLFGWISKTFFRYSTHHNAWMWMAQDCEDTPQKDAYQQWQLVTWQTKIQEICAKITLMHFLQGLRVKRDPHNISISIRNLNLWADMNIPVVPHKAVAEVSQ